MMKHLLKRLVPARFRPFARRIYERSLGPLEDSVVKGDPLLPPEHLIFVGGDSQDFKQLGEKWLQTFISLGGLMPHESVLDVGSGVGRMAIPLAHYLQKEARYDGFEIVNEGVRWCQQQITTRFPNFRFQHADVYSSFTK